MFSFFYSTSLAFAKILCYNIINSYVYDAWGNVLRITDNSGNEIPLTADHIANKNPFRFRGYYYDSETGLYYCNARYYDPTTGRFISADDISYLDPETINGLNLFSYCGNNPVMNVDPSGHSVILAMLLGAGIGLALGLGGQFVSDVISNFMENGFSFSDWQMSSWQTYVGAGLGGAIGGALTPFLGPVATAFITGASSTAISMGLSNATGDTNYSLGEIISTTLIIGGFSAMTAGILDTTKIPKLNAGRGSLSAISKQINTKFINNTIKRISIKTFGKMTLLNAAYSLPFAFFNGFFTNGMIFKSIY